jgi:hypothetical protein
MMVPVYRSTTTWFFGLGGMPGERTLAHLRFFPVPEHTEHFDDGEPYYHVRGDGETPHVFVEVPDGSEVIERNRVPSAVRLAGTQTAIDPDHLVMLARDGLCGLRLVSLKEVQSGPKRKARRRVTATASA